MWTVHLNLSQNKARRKNVGSKKKLHQKIRRLKAQLMDMFSGKFQFPLDSTNLPDSATNELATSDSPPGQAGAATPPEGSCEGGGARLNRDARRGEHGSTVDGLQR